jgi:hypothetical protein
VAFLDSDDYWTDRHLERATAAITATDGRADFYFADTERTPAEGSDRLWALSDFAIEPPHQLAEDGTEWVMLPRQPMMLQSAVFRRDRYLEIGGLAPELRRRHDTHLFFRLGLGRPICAVAGVGTVMTADDTGGRLTVVADSNSKVFAVHTVDLYADLLTRYPDLPAEHRDELRVRLVEGRLKQASLAVRERDFVGAVGPLLRAARMDPARVARRLNRFSRRHGS